MRDASDSASAPAPAPAPARLRSQSTATRKVAPATTISAAAAAERLLPNGDLYSGSFSGTVPHGAGKYLWSDGCMYEGEWRRGKASGKGKFSWPSGATYEGEFKAGRMDGYGTFTGSEGDTYRGTWSADRKHGFGEKSYANGDLYVGFWRRNVQDGQGRYVWRNGNEYVGHWRNGVISGNGVLIWANGDRFEGQWINGVPKAKTGEFTRDDLKDGVRKSGLEDRSRKRYSVDGRRMSLGVERSFPRICIWESDGEAGDITCDIIDNVEASKFYRGGDGGSAALRSVPARSSRCWFMGEEVKKPGETISKGHKNYDLMLNLQLGIRYCVGKPGLRDLRMSDFDPREKFWTRFPPEGSKVTPPHQSVEFRWKDYCPNVFRHLRELFAIDPADYMLAICGDDALRELSSPGKSGSIFYMTQDDRFMIKTVKKSEVKVLLRMLPSYFEHVRQHENSLVTKFFGVHCVKPLGGPKVRFIIMGNLFCSEYRIHRRFDLKGSSHGRTTDKSEGEIDETTTLKDLDLNFVFHLQKSWFEDLLRQIDQDCEFLEAERIMDYSLLVGLHFLDDQSIDKMGLSPHVARPSQRESLQGESGISRLHFLEAEGPQDIDRILTRWNPSIRLGANMPARAEQLVRNDLDQYRSTGGESTPTRSGDFHEVILYFGIIDILQDYDISKKLEHAYKSLQADPTSISAVDPKLYSKRFRDFIRRVFIVDS